MSEDKPKRSYAKASYKTKPYTVRFDIEKFNFFMSREKLETAQQLVDHFLNGYWWQWKVAKPTHKDVPPVYDAPKIENPVHDEPKQWAEPKIGQYEAYQQEISEANSIPEVEAISREIKKDTIPDWQKKKLEQLAVEKSKTFDF